ncbi:helix-turn-helix domain-containing protein [Pseudonocardia sp.]|uniref:helix-turn-helix domain-containing protein n=1 Tax=Pseudonocardia sp. TaxID=60912 RepID=UPI0031FCDD68
MSRERRMIEPEVREPLWGVEEVSAYLGVPVRTLYQWRTKNYGPHGMRVGRHLRYKASDVVRWLDELGEVDSV